MSGNLTELDRRQLLVLLGASSLAVAGCLGDGGDDDTDNGISSDSSRNDTDEELPQDDDDAEDPAGGDESDAQANDMIDIQHDFIPAIDVSGVRGFCEFVPTVENMSEKRLDQVIITIDLFDRSTIIESNEVWLGEIPASRNASSQALLADFTDYSTDPEEAVTEYILRIEIVTEDGEQEEFNLKFDGADFRDRYNDREQFVEFIDHEIVFQQGNFIETTVVLENIHENPIDLYSIHLRALDNSNVIYEDAVPFATGIGVNARVEQLVSLSNFPDLEQMTSYEIEIRSALENSVPGEIVIEEFDKENIIDRRG